MASLSLKALSVGRNTAQLHPDHFTNLNIGKIGGHAGTDRNHLIRINVRHTV